MKKNILEEIPDENIEFDLFISEPKFQHMKTK